jgi:hypothetical protein
MGKLELSVMRTVPPLLLIGVWASMWWVKRWVEGWNAGGRSCGIEDGVEPWKMYFSDVGMFLKS